MIISVGSFVLLLMVIYRTAIRRAGRQAYEEQLQQLKGDDQDNLADSIAHSATPSAYDRLGEHFRLHHGRFWRRKTRIFLLIGEMEQAEALAPGLANDHWLEGDGTLLLWGGDASVEPDEELMVRLRALRRRRPLDGIVWAMDETQINQPKHIERGLRRLQRQAQRLGWHAPLYLWQVRHSEWPQDDRPSAAVGCLLQVESTSEYLSAGMHDLIAPLRRHGMNQVLASEGHDFLLRLSQYLQQDGIALWQRALKPLWRDFNSILCLRGLMFSLPVKSRETEADYGWLPDPAWQGILNDSMARGRRVGFSWARNALLSGLCLVLLWGCGSLLSFFYNRAQIVTVGHQLASLKENAPLSEQLKALRKLSGEMERLQYISTQGALWHQRFGLNQNDMLLAALWPQYGKFNNRLVRDAAARQLHGQLSALVALPPDSPQRSERSRSGYEQLKAYLMMAYPEKADAGFLTRVFIENEAAPKGVPLGLWQNLTPGLWGFYAANLAGHRDWHITPDMDLVAQVRRLLLAQIGQRNAEAAIYQKMLRLAANNYADLSLENMVGDTEAHRLFSSTEVVPGIFTRQAWEGQVQSAVAEAVASRREEIDWVLSDGKKAVATEASPEALKARLIERYFNDFSGAWLNFLNSLRWNQVKNLSDVADQLTLMADIRQSPLIALMNTLSFQGQTGQREEALSDSLVKSVQNLLHKDNLPAIDQRPAGMTGPLDSTFDPLLAIMGKGNSSGVFAGDSSLSLQTFLTRVTRVRLKLQQAANATDPQEMTQLLAQSVFQGKNIDLTDTQEYGGLIAASLGEEWSGFARAIFVQPLTQAWQKVLQPSAASLNVQWRTSIVDNWNRAFTGRYPFADTRSDASLPMLGQFVRAESGKIDQFLTRQLGGVLHKEGNRWVPDKVNGQGLRFNPDFLQAINQLSRLADILYIDGGMGMGFDLMGKPVRRVVETTLNLDGRKLRYFNQQESWRNFHWPGASDKPGVMLSWSTVDAGPRLFVDEQGHWGLIRLLEQAAVTALDDGDTLFRVVLTAPDGLPLTWHLRTEVAEGPLALLKLRGFSLPTRIFDVAAGRSAHVSNTAPSWEDD
ncbi:ImcF-related family protein [Acerihabitans sp. KWT182]|uniref:ImcF-related family protein n=1 Tax=Acerihabitans sp. KWT182 TaxID=3157919 RepID=A0AAU7Q9S1_9GAMM